MSFLPDAIAQLRAELDNGLSLPASWYTDPAISAAERERVYRRGWQWVGRTDEVGATGDYLTAMAGKLPVVVVRGAEGPRAFVNVSATAATR